MSNYKLPPMEIVKASHELMSVDEGDFLPIEYTAMLLGTTVESILKIVKMHGLAYSVDWDENSNWENEDDRSSDTQKIYLPSDTVQILVMACESKKARDIQALLLQIIEKTQGSEGIEF